MALSTNNVVIARLAAGMYGMQLGWDTMQSAVNDSDGTDAGLKALMNTLYGRDFAFATDADVASALVANLGITGADAASAASYVEGQLGAAAAGQKGATVVDLVNLFAGLTADPIWGPYAAAFNTQIARAVTYANNNSNDVMVSAVVPTFTLNAATAAGADVMRLTGNMDARIDFTNPANQVRGLDLDGDGQIEINGIENVSSNFSAAQRGANFEIVDAYSRNPLNHLDTANNFLGDIQFDGTGFKGDGVNTNGNIFLGGLGADIAFGGIGNDFLAGGGIAQNHGGWDRMSGGRNADFFFAEFSGLDSVDGSGVGTGNRSLSIDGGNTADDTSPNQHSAQDSDWLLFEASDDDEPVTVWLNERTGEAGPNSWYTDVQSRFGEEMQISDVENFDASGNFYGFLDDMDVRIGGRATDDRGPTNAEVGYNFGFGSSAQLVVYGSEVGNIIIGGYDNDTIYGEDGDDLLMGGNLNFLHNPNSIGITDNGIDALYGGNGNDNIVFEADGGTIDGEDGTDTLWLTRESTGTMSTDDVTTDGTLRFDLLSQSLSSAAGYGGADVDGTQDQSNYGSESSRVTVNNMENVIATGLGAVDYLASGANKPELTFTNQQNHFAFVGNLDLRGSNGANTLYAVGGTDVIEGRQGNDKMSGGDGNDDFIFAIDGHNGGEDGVDVIHRQSDANGDNIWDTSAAGKNLYERDFNIGGTSTKGASSLTVDLGTTDLSSPDVAMTSFSIKIDGTTFAVTDAAALSAATSAAAVAALVNTAYQAIDAKVSAVAVGNTIVVTDIDGRDISDTVSEGYAVGGVVSNGAFSAQAIFAPAGTTTTKDRLIYKSYEDRNDNEAVDDDSFDGSEISLGSRGYAEDLVINFADEDGNGAATTRIAESQQYRIDFTNLTTEDSVVVTVNGVNYALKVGTDLDGNDIDNENTNHENQADIQANFLARLSDFINTFMDDDTSVGALDTNASATSLWLWQRDYNGEETVFMAKPVVTLGNQSGGEPASSTVTNVSAHEVELLDFDGRNGELNSTNVLFIGDTGINRANLQTAKNAGDTITGTDAVLIDGAADDLQAVIFGTTTAIANNTSTNVELRTNFSSHGDDFLLGGNGNDTINAGTGDDRVEGSTGTDAVDGGKNYYAVKVLGEAQSRVYVLNKWEAANPSKVTALSSLTISSITLIDQNEGGHGTDNGVFDDTLQFSQARFMAGTSRFTVTLNDFALAAGGVVELRNDGAGTVGVDADGNGTIDHTTTFKNFENIRTVSGTGNAVAGSGQGNDTLDVTAMSNLTTGAGGISYDLTNGGTAGEVRYSTNAIITAAVAPAVEGTSAADRPVIADYESLVLRVDGVENVKSGTGHDLLRIDETEAAKDNRFDAGLGVDRIEYLNDFKAGIDGTAQPTVAIKVNTATDTDTVTMTGGRVGLLNTASGGAVDTLTGVEYIALGGETAQSSREDDVLDVTAMTSGAIVDYTNGEIRTGAAAGTGVQLVVEGIVQMENVWADGNDTVIVADADVMNNNARSDEGVDGTAAQNILFMTYRDYDDLNTGATTRKSFAAQVADGTIQKVINQGQFTFDLSRVGTDVDVDRVDYSAELGRIVVPVGQATATTPQYVVVDGDNDQSFSDSESRVDVLLSVEEIVAAQGRSVLDFTGGTAARQITFQYVAPAANPAENGRLEQTIRIADGSGNALTGLNAFVERYTYNKTTPAVADATWNQVEGSDAAEVVIYQGSEDLVNQAGLDHRYTVDVLNLRGGNNEVRYSPLETSITALISVTEEDTTTVGVAEGNINAVITFQDGLGAALVGGGSHTINSNSSDNSTAAGNLKIEGSQDAEDSVSFAATGQKTFILGTSPGVVNVNIGALNSIVLTGFEFLLDPTTDDVYTFASLASTFGLTLTDNGAQDHDTVKVGNDAIGFNTGTLLHISLDWISSATDGGDADALPGFNFDFDVLDVTGVTTSGLTLDGGTNGVGPANADADASDEVVLGALSLVTTITNFESMVLTQASTAAGTNFTFNPGANTLSQGSTTVSTTANELSFGGLVLEQNNGYGMSSVADATTGVTVAIAGNAGATVHGGAGADTITGGSVADVIRGNGGNDTLSGGISAEVRTMQLDGIADGGADDVTVDFNGYPVTVNEGVDYLAGAGSDAIGAALAAAITADLANVNTGAAWSNGAVLLSATFDSGTDLLTFTFNTGVDVLVGEAITGSTTEGGTFAIEATAATAIEGGNGGADTFLFEATAAKNGTDSISQFDSADMMDFSAFFAGTYLGATTGYDFGANVPEFGGTGYGGNYVVVGHNKATLVAADFAGANVNNDNMKSVYVTTADADGVFGGADVTNNGWKAYFVYDADPTAGVNIVVSLVANVQQNAEFYFNGTDFIG